MQQLYVEHVYVSTACLFTLHTHARAVASFVVFLTFWKYLARAEKLNVHTVLIETCYMYEPYLGKTGYTYAHAAYLITIRRSPGSTVASSEC